MNTSILFFGTASMTVLGLMTENVSAVSVGLGLMWLGLSIKSHPS